MLICQRYEFRPQPAANAEEMMLVHAFVRLIRAVRPWLVNVVSLPLTFQTVSINCIMKSQLLCDHLPGGSTGCLHGVMLGY